MLYSLKYYSTRWLRAKLYAEMAGFLQTREALTMFQEFNRHMGHTGEGYQRLNERLLDAAGGVNDHDFDDVEIPSTDIFTQEFFFQAYSLLSQDRRSFHESSEGFTYMKHARERVATSKVLTYLYGEPPRNKAAWETRVRTNIKKIKVNKLDPSETDFIEFDLILSYYMEEYRKLRRKWMNDIKHKVDEVNNANARHKMDFSMRDVQSIIQAILPPKSPGSLVSFAKEITHARAFIYALQCGQNNGTVDAAALLAGCNRFGLDSPIPTITKRLATYGNTEDVVDLVRKAAEAHKARAPQDPDVDLELYCPAELKLTNSHDGDTTRKRAGHLDFQETQAASPLKKIAAMFNYNLVHHAKTTGEDALLTTDEQELKIKQNKDYLVGGIRMNIKDIKAI